LILTIAEQALTTKEYTLTIKKCTLTIKKYTQAIKKSNGTIMKYGKSSNNLTIMNAKHKNNLDKYRIKF